MGGADKRVSERARESEFINSVVVWETDFARPKGHEGGVRSSTGSTLHYFVRVCVLGTQMDCTEVTWREEKSRVA